MWLAPISAVFFSVMYSPSYAQDRPDVTNPAVVEAFVDGVVKTNMKSAHSPSGVVAVMKNETLIFSKGYGFLDVEKRIPVDPETTLFRPGSISKLLLTAVRFKSAPLRPASTQRLQLVM